MDILRKELAGFYASQHLESEVRERSVVEECCRIVESAARLDDDCRVVTDAAADRCYIYGGGLARLLGLNPREGSYCDTFGSSDEDILYGRMHPEDLVEKRMLEYEFFKYADMLPQAAKLSCKALCRIRIRNLEGNYILIDNSTQVLRLTPGGRIWLILCCYKLSPDAERGEGISPRIQNLATGEIAAMNLHGRRAEVLSGREKEILLLIKSGKLSKQIAGILGISVHTVNRHRQNILSKLSVGNSVEAVMAAEAMKLL